MTTPSPELQEQVRESFVRLEPERIFRGCKVAEEGGVVIVRVYSHHQRTQTLMPTPYWIYRFDAARGTLSPLSKEDAAPYIIQNYK